MKRRPGIAGLQRGAQARVRQTLHSHSCPMQHDRPKEKLRALPSITPNPSIAPSFTSPVFQDDEAPPSRSKDRQSSCFNMHAT